MCGVCKERNIAEEWLIQCDECDRYFHFRCVQVDNIMPEDPWSCMECNKTAAIIETDLGGSTKEIQPQQRTLLSNSSSRCKDEDIVEKQPEKLIVVADVHRADDTSRESTKDCLKEKVDESHPLNAKKTSTRPSSVRSNHHSALTNVSTVISVSSSQRESLELNKIQEELELQAAVDAEMLAIKMEAVKLKQLRESKFIKEKYKALSVTNGSNRSRGSNKTERSSYVSSWVESQQMQNQNRSESLRQDIERFSERIDQFNFDVSIPVEPYERERIIQARSHRSGDPVYNQGILKNSQTVMTLKDIDGTVDYERHMSSTTNQAKNPAKVSIPQNSYEPTASSKPPPSVNYPNKLGQYSASGGNESSRQPLHHNVQRPKDERISSHYSTGNLSNQTYVTTSHNTNHLNQTFTHKQPAYNRNVSTNPKYAGSNASMMKTQPTHSAVGNSSVQNAKQRNLPFIQGHLSTNQIAARHAVKKDLPKFDGNPNEWCRFIKKFENTTQMCGYSNAENIDRLSDSLEGKAKDIVESLLIMPECVPEIIEMLEDKFGRPEMIINAALMKIRSEPQIKADKLEDLANYGYKIRNLCNTIKTMNIHFHLYNPELIQELVKKLPHQTKIDWVRYSESLPQVTLIELSEWMYCLSRSLNRITALEYSYDVKSDSNAKKGHVNLHDGSNSKEYLHGESLLENRVTEPQRCRVCSKGCKNLSECSKFKGQNVDERWQEVIEHKLCRICLKRHSRRCALAKSCGINGCIFKHHSLLHNDQRHNRQSNHPTAKSIVTVGDNDIEQTSTGHSNVHFDHQCEMFRIVPVTLHWKDRSFSTFAFLDEGSSFTLLERRVADTLALNGAPERICLLWTKKVHRQEDSEIVDLDIASKHEPSIRHKLRGVNIVEELDLPEQSLPVEDLKRRYKHLKELPLTEYKKAIPTILIGLKHARLTVPLETIEGGMEDPIATRSRLGWSIHGPVRNSSSGFVNVHGVTRCPCQERDDEIHKLIKDHFTIENFGVVANDACNGSKDDAKALEMLKKFTVRKNNRFESRFLWKNEFVKLPDSYPMARKRLSCLENKGPKVIETINESVKDYLQKGYVSKLSPDQVVKKCDRVWYLPLFTVKNPKKPGKLRTVFDAAAKVKGTSLNSVLFTGPDLSTSIVDILRRFREHRIGINGDIREFHQVSVNEDDRHAQRFLWRNGEKDRDPDEYVVNVLTFGSTCSPSTAQFIKNINAMEFSNRFPRAVEAIIKNHYVDDLMDGTDTTEEAIKLINDVKFVHSQGGFEIRNFKSNSMEVLKAIGVPVDDEKISMDDGSKTERVLGMFWHTKSDAFTFSLQFTKVTADVLTNKRSPTKRELLKLLMSIFDPLGLLSYYLIHLKIVLQDAWRTKMKWDDPLFEELEPHWRRWIEILPNVEMLRIPRWYKDNLAETSDIIQLHVFVDAGEDAFSAVSYLRFETSSGFSSSLVGSKARVTPLKYMSVPRKELSAALLGVRLSKSIRDGLSLKIGKLFIWSDSMTVLTWIHSDHRKYSQFVAHRVGEILETTELNEWRWVSSQSNIADEATKWKNTPTFNATDRWFKGPEILNLSEEDWPKQPKAIVPNSTPEEMRLSCSHSKLILPSIIDRARLSKWERVIRAVASAIRWGCKLLSKIRKVQQPLGALTHEELAKAERFLFRQAQWEGLTDEMLTLTRNQRNKRNPKKKQYTIDKGSPIHDCNPYLDEFGVMRHQGRNDNATALTFDSKRPIILPRNHQFTKLIALSYHVKFLHRNHETVINELRQRFHIPRIRVMFRSVRWNCKMCEVKRCQPKVPQMASLPMIRFEPGIRAFTFTGIDYFGPIKVMVRRTPEKRWGVLMTCLTVRAIHIELVPSLNTESCIKAIRNFINFRGCPRELFSDNGTNFKGADNELTAEIQKLDQQKFSETFSSCYLKWNFNPPASPHMGGAWERLIRTVKDCMKESMLPRTPKEEDLRSLLLEIMNIVNARPLTFIPLDSDEAEALTPNHFIFGTSNGLKPPGNFDIDGQYLRSAWKEIQRCTNIFWRRFIKEYTPTLTRRTKWFELVKPLTVGDLVMNIDANQPRNTYKRARIVETIVGSNDQVRRAKIQMADGSTLWRPAANLAKLDLIDSAPPDTGSLDHKSIDQNWGEYVGASNSKSCSNSVPPINANDNAN